MIRLLAAGAEMLAVGGTVSTVKLFWVKSVLPARSVASTLTVWTPSPRVARLAPEAGVGFTGVPSTVTTVAAGFGLASVMA